MTATDKCKFIILSMLHNKKTKDSSIVKPLLTRLIKEFNHDNNWISNQFIALYNADFINGVMEFQESRLGYYVHTDDTPLNHDLNWLTPSGEDALKYLTKLGDRGNKK